MRSETLTKQSSHMPSGFYNTDALTFCTKTTALERAVAYIDVSNVLLLSVTVAAMSF